MTVTIYTYENDAVISNVHTIIPSDDGKRLFLLQTSGEELEIKIKDLRQIEQ